MLTKTLRSKIDKIWENLQISPLDPLSFIEQISFLMLARMLDMRWSHFKNLNGDDMLKVVRDEVFPQMIGSNVGKYMANAQLKIDNPHLLKSVVNTIDQLPLMESAGELYEYLLSKLTSAGMKGQFRTPRHIVRLMVEMLDPQPDEIIADPVCGTGGFLVGVLQYIKENNTLLDPIQNDRLHGFDFDSTMLRLAAINLMLHGIKAPKLYYQDLLNNNFYKNFPELSNNYFDLILANPPLVSRFDNEAVHASPIGKVRTKKTELLFIARILNMLKPGARAAIIVPNSVLFASSKAHTALRQLLVEKNQLAAVISLPSAVFHPYTNASVAVLIFTKRKESNKYTDNVFFYDVQADGFSLDKKRVPVKANDLPEVLQHWKAKNINKNSDRTAKAFYVPLQEIRDNKYDLSINRYKEIVSEEMVYEPPLEILAKMKNIATEIQEDLKELEKMLEPPLARQDKFAKIMQTVEICRAHQEESEQQREHLLRSLTQSTPK